MFRIEERPFHCDEAVQAMKFGELLEEGRYEYDPREYHGPTLYYLSLPIAWLSGSETIEQVSERQLRALTVIFGAGVVLLLLLAGDGLGSTAAVCAAALTAISPFMVYFSRYYIQEILLIFFTLGMILSGWRYYKSPRAFWIIMIGFFAAMMFATKETCVIPWFAMGVALIVVARRNLLGMFKIHRIHLLLGALSFIFIWVAFLSSFGTHPRGVIDSIMTYVGYLDRAGGAGHEHPWYYHLKWLFWHREHGVLWSEGLIFILALYGGVRSFLPKFGRDPYLARFLAVYTLVLMVVYSVIPYKTPWLGLGFLQPAIMLAGVGAVKLVVDLRFRILQIACIAVLAYSFHGLARQMRLSSFLYHADERNPAVYSHTSTNAVRLADQVRDVVTLAPDGKYTSIKVISPEYWPMPWYWRDLARVGYWFELPANPRAPIVVTTPFFAEQIRPMLEGEYFETIAGLRPNFFLQVFIKQELWDRYVEELAQ